jgi:hypothetical protein
MTACTRWPATGCWWSPERRTATPCAGSFRRSRTADLVLESEPKDSGAAIGLAAAILHERDPDTIMGSFAADQVISPDSLFQEAVREAIHTAAAGKIVTIGIKPTHPSTGFGYIRSGQLLHIDGAPSAQDVVEFVEKPNEEVAQQYVDSGNYVWNAGMFVAPVSLLLKHLEANQPELFRACRKSRRPGTPPTATRSPPVSGPPCPRSPSTMRWPNLPPKPGTSPSYPAPSAGTTSVTSLPWAGSTVPRKWTTSPCSARARACSPRTPAAWW